MDAKKKKLLETTYRNYFQAMVNEASWKNIGQWVDKAAMGYGTTRDEKVFGLEELEEILARQQQQAEGLEMKFDERPVFRWISPDENTAVFVDEGDLTFFIGEGKHELFLRIFSVLEYTNNQWTVIHWHASKPGNTDGTEGTWHLNEWQRRNAELEKIVAEKTADLALKNRELEIEMALERVRARTMAMHKTDELRSVIHTVFEQFKILGFDATACGLTLFKKDDKSMILWLAGFDTDAYPESYFVPRFDHPLYNAQFEAWENGQTYRVFKFEGELKKSYDELIFELGDFKYLPSSAKEAILSAFRYLANYLYELPQTPEKQVVFLDEMPWLDTPKSEFMPALEFFWNQHVSRMDNILLIACGSASSWIRKNLINARGGLYNRITQRIKLMPFNLYETESFLQSMGVRPDRYDY